jgi:hypothetical protein
MIDTTGAARKDWHRTIFSGTDATSPDHS